MIKSLRDAAGYVDNAFLVKEAAYQPENIVIGSYTFLPWVRTGIAAFATGPDDGVRSRVPVRLTVDDQVATETVDQTLELYGPGDVIGIDPAQIVRRVPAPNASAVEGNYLAHIEFDRPDLPWLFSPFSAAGEHLAPWLALVVLRAETVEPRPGRDGRPPSVTTILGELQPLDDSWAWAHAQLIGSPGDGDLGDRLGSGYGPANLSRILCPRRLEDADPDRGQEWLACLVPAIDVGRRVALGLPGGDLGPAWQRKPNNADANDAIELPVFDSWSFRTGKDGDFESLATLLVAVPAPYEVGRRVIDASQPQGGHEEKLGPNEDGRRQVVRGPLVSPLTDKPPGAPDDDAAWDATRTGRLVDRLDQADHLANEPGGVSAELRPLVGPEIYGRYHLARQRVDGEAAAPDATWFGQINLRPVHRVVAGLGTRVVQRDQEPLMQAAWAQVGQVQAANQWVRAAQLSRFAATSVHRKLSVVPEGDLLSITRRVQSRIGLPDGVTVEARIAVSATPTIAVSSAFRRATRVRGPIARFAPTDVARTAIRSLIVEAAGPRDFARPYVELDGIRSLSEGTIAMLSPELVAPVFGNGGGDPMQHLRDRVSSLANPSPADGLTSVAIGAMTLAPDFQVADVATRRVLAAMPGAAVASTSLGPAVAASHLGLLQGLKTVTTSASPEVSASVVALSTALTSVEELSAATTSAVDEAALSQSRLERATAQREAAVTGGQSGLSVALATAAESEARQATVSAAQTVIVTEAVTASARAFADALANRPPAEVASGFATSPFVERFATSAIFSAAPTHIVTPVHAVPAHLGVLMGAGPAIAPQPPAGIVVHPIDPAAAVIGPAGGAHVVIHHDAAGQVVGIDPHAEIGGVLGGHGAAHVEPGAPVEPVVVLTPAAGRLQALMTTAVGVSPDAFKAGLAGAVDGFVSAAWPRTPVRPALAITKTAVLDPLRPDATISARIDHALVKPRWLPPDWFADRLVQPIMAAPLFTRAMYEALDAYNRDWLIPGLGKMKEPDLVTALVTNAAFIEGFFVGLSHEMGRELLWRGYPTDQRGTYFRRFFDHGHDDLSVNGQPGFIHRFAPTPLGSHLLSTLDGRIVFLIRGELIRRYPDALVAVTRQQGEDQQGRPTFSTVHETPLFLAPLEPNIVLAGFDLTKDEVLAADTAHDHPFWLTISEHPTGPRFGLDEPPKPGEPPPPPPPPPFTLSRANLAWGELTTQPDGLFLHAGSDVVMADDAGSVTWGRDAATNAHILLQDPVRAAFPVAQLLKDIDHGGPDHG